MEINQEIQKKILVKLMHKPGMKFNELWNKEGESNKFNYHLKSLYDLELLEKEEDKYKLTAKGQTYVTNLNGETGEIQKAPVICSFILGYKKETNEILINIRKKEPFYDYVGMPGGKIEFGSCPQKTAEKEFLEETGLKGNLRLSAVSNYNTFNNGDLLHHLVAFTYIAENCEGKLIEKNREGENKWIKLLELKDLIHYPELDIFINKIIKSNEICYFNIDRFQENGKFLKHFELKEKF